MEISNREHQKIKVDNLALKWVKDNDLSPIKTGHYIKIGHGPYCKWFREHSDGTTRTTRTEEESLTKAFLHFYLDGLTYDPDKKLNTIEEVSYYFKSINLQQLINQRGLVKPQLEEKLGGTHQPINYDLEGKEIDLIIDTIIEGQTKTKAKIYNVLMYGTPQLGYLTQIQYDPGRSWSFGAGQSYPDEIRAMRKALAR